MAEHGALMTLKDLAEKRAEDVAHLLDEMRRGCQWAKERLKMLIDYQNEYRNNLNSDMSAGIANNHWICLSHTSPSPRDSSGSGC